MDKNKMHEGASRLPITVKFGEVREAGFIFSRLVIGGGSDLTPLYVTSFDTSGRMLVAIFDGSECRGDPSTTYVNPCGEDIIEEAGLSAEIFNTEYEGGIFQILGDEFLESTKAEISRRLIALERALRDSRTQGFESGSEG